MIYSYFSLKSVTISSYDGISVIDSDNADNKKESEKYLELLY